MLIDKRIHRAAEEVDSVAYISMQPIIPTRATLSWGAEYQSDLTS